MSAGLFSFLVALFQVGLGRVENKKEGGLTRVENRKEGGLTRVENRREVWVGLKTGRMFGPSRNQRGGLGHVVFPTTKPFFIFFSTRPKHSVIRSVDIIVL